MGHSLTARAAAVALTIACAIGVHDAAAAQQIARSDAAEELRLRVERIRSEGGIEIAGDTIAAGSVAEFYEARGFVPAWRVAGRSAIVLDAVDAMAAEGLDPADYHARALRTFAAIRPRSPADSAAQDLLLTSAVHRIMHDLGSGRADRSLLDAAWAVDEGVASAPDASRLAAVVDAADLTATLDSLRPRHSIYSGMREALARYRGYLAEGGWPVVPAGTVMRRDSAAGPIQLLRRRLALEGFLDEAGSTGPPTFDSSLEAAVVAFQHTHGLNEDGIAGRATIAELNVSVERRIDAIRVNMERARWVLPGLADRFVAANIAGQKVYYVDDGDVVFETRAVVGTLYRRTPVFADTMRYIVVNPTWTVPRSINGEILAGIRADPTYLVSRDIVVIDRAEDRVDARTIDFGEYTATTFPWVFRQLPGPSNPLGRIKFMFPNPYDVYLHDTPAREQFSREERTFSHGCIRVEDPFRLAELVLSGQAGTDPASLMRIVESGRTATIRIERPLPVLLLYWTAAADLHGELHFYRDIYGRDDAVLAALDSPARR